ncbi:MAG: hypothetical protein GXY76_22975 [Chloroflexi bacterium]|nr:hypothetical protein [Chloroflexota bacterium]
MTTQDAGEIISIHDLVPDERNARRHSERGLGLIADGMGKVGAARSIVIDEAGRILAGNATVQAAARAGISRILVVDADGRTLVAVRRRGLDESGKRALAYYDNRTGELSDWDPEQIASDAAQGLPAIHAIFTDAELMQLMGQAEATEPAAGPAGNRAAYAFLDAMDAGEVERAAPAAPRRGYPLAIVLDHDEYATWVAAKEEIGVKDDKQALLALLRMV